MENKFRNKTIRKPSSSKKTISIFSVEDVPKSSTLTIEECKKETKKDEKTISNKSEPVRSDSMNPDFISLLSAESVSALKKPWLRLERGIRIQKFRQFASEFLDSEGTNLSEKEKDLLVKSLVACNDTKLLNSKQSVIYDSDEGKIVDIKGLKMTRSSDGNVSFKIETSRPTKRSKPSESKIEFE